MNKKLVMAGVFATVISSGAFAQASANFTLTGTINPNACNISLGSGGFNFGSLPKATVQGYTTFLNTYNFPAPQAVPLTVDCGGASTKVELQFVDNKSGQRLAIDSADPIRYGVSDTAGGTVAIGAYAVTLNTTSGLLIDGVAPAGALAAPNGTTTWSTATAGGQAASLYAAPGYTVGFIKTVGNTVPDSFALLTGTISAGLNVSQAYVNSATNTIQLYGSGTITLVYL